MQWLINLPCCSNNNRKLLTFTFTVKSILEISQLWSSVPIGEELYEALYVYSMEEKEDSEVIYRAMTIWYSCVCA